MDILDELITDSPEATAFLAEMRAAAKEPLPLPDEAYEKFNPMWGEE